MKKGIAKKNGYIYYFSEKILAIVLFITGIMIGIVTHAKAIVVLGLIFLLVYFITEYICEDLRAFWFIFDLKKGKITREATFEYTESQSTEEVTWRSMFLSTERYLQAYSEICFREKELRGTYYVFGDDRKLVSVPDIRNNNIIKRGDKVQITYFEKSRLIVNIKKIK